MISIAHNGQELGQFSADEVAAMVEVGQIDQTAHYWTEGMTEWRPITEIIQVDPVEVETNESDVVQSYRWRRLAAAAVLLLLVWPFSLTFGLAFLTGIPWWGAAAVAFLTFSLVRSILFGPLYRCGRCHKRSYLSYALAVVVVGLGGAGLWLAATSL